MSVDKLTPTDSRVQHRFAELNGNKYHYLLAEPRGTPKATIFLVHGWPDCSFGWRYQIPMLADMGLRVVVPDMMGYGQSASPQDLKAYTLKAASDDLAALAAELNLHEIFILGHDWGGMVVWRFALWHPKLVKAVISICTPYMAPQKQYYPLEALVKSVLPNFKYQLQLSGPEVQEKIQGKEKIKQFLNGVYGGSGSEGQMGFSTEVGVLFDNLPNLGPSRLLDAAELEFYAEQYAINGMRGPLNWYRTRQLNYEEELPLAEKEDLLVEQPSLFVTATQDAALPPAMSQGMEKRFVSLERGEVEANHWALWQVPEQCNKLIKEFLVKQLANAAKL